MRVLGTRSSMPWFTRKNLYDIQTKEGKKRQMVPEILSWIYFPPESGALPSQHPAALWLAVISGSHELSLLFSNLEFQNRSFPPGHEVQFLHLASSSLGYLFFIKMHTSSSRLSAEHHYGQIERQRLRGFEATVLLVIAGSSGFGAK